MSADPPAASAPAQPLRMGVFPLAAGSAGAAQGQPAPEDPAKALAALQRLRPPGRELIVRLNRMFWADGDAGPGALRRAGRRLRRRGLPDRAPGPLPPAGGPRGRHRGLAGVRPRRRAHVRPAALGGRALDHQRGEPARLAEHLRRLLRGRARRPRAGRDRRARRGGPARPGGPLDRVLLRLPQQPGVRRRVLGGARPQGRRGVRGGRRPRRPAGLPRAVLAAGDDRPGGRRDRGDDAAALVLDAEGGSRRGRAALGDRERLRDARRHGRGAPGGRPDRDARRPRALLGHARDHRLPLLQPARQPLDRDGPVRRGRPAVRRLPGEGGVRGVPGRGGASRRAAPPAAAPCRAGNGATAGVAGDRPAANGGAGPPDAAAHPRAERRPRRRKGACTGGEEAHADRSLRARPAALPLRRPAGPEARTRDERRAPGYRSHPHPPRGT